MDTHHGSDSSSRTTRSSRLKRKPFSDLTNTPSSLLKTKPKCKPVAESEPKSKPKLAIEPAHAKPAVSSTAGEQENDGDLATAASTPKSKEITEDLGKGVGNNDKLDISSVSPQLVKASKKGKKVVEAAPALSCPPLGQIRNIERNMRLKDHIGGLHNAFSVPPDKVKKRKKHHRTVAKLHKPILPPDFVEKQRAYFAEIDAFELPEEEVSDGELE